MQRHISNTEGRQPVTKAEENRQRIAANKLAAFERKVCTLTGHVMRRIPAKELHEAFAEGKEAEVFAAEIASREPVGRALHLGKADAVADAAKQARETVEKVRADLEANAWDIHAAAPYPYRGHGYAAEMARAKANRYQRLSKDDPALPYQGSRPGEPRIVVMSDEGIASFVEGAERGAATYYDAFIVKMVAKVGEAQDATIDGSHVWSHSILTVTLKDGTVERWKTQQIQNYSKLGFPFPQWPSRKLKD